MFKRLKKIQRYQLFLLFILLAVFFFSVYNLAETEKKTVAFSEFISSFKEGRYKEVKGYPGTGSSLLRGKTKEGKTESVIVFDAQLMDISKENPDLYNKISFMEKKTSQPLFNILMVIVSSYILFRILSDILFRRPPVDYSDLKELDPDDYEGSLKFGKVKARVMDTGEGEIVDFSSVAGSDEEKEELGEVVDFLKNPGKYEALGAKIPKGVLMVGEPGTGKTLLARAVAGEAKVPFYIISGSDFVEMYVGVGAARVRDLFAKAKENAPSIIFLDEIDAVGRMRGTGFGGGHDEREQTLNQLLVEMDGFSRNQGVVVMAATNRADVLDKALLRPGRFDRQIFISLPDAREREEILKLHTMNKPISHDVNLKVLAGSTTGFSGAELENMANEAAILASRHNKSIISMEDFEEARSKVQLGHMKKKKILSGYSRKLTAYHEAGHALVSRMIPGMDPLFKISIIPRGQAGGFTMHLPKEDILYKSRSELMNSLCVLYGGRAAEKIMLGDISTGAKSDIARATSIARAMVTEYGMSSELSNISFPMGEEAFLGREMGKNRYFSSATLDLIDREVISILDEASKRSEEILKKEKDRLNLIAEKLMERETLEAFEFESLFTRGILPEIENLEGRRKANEGVIEKTV